MKEKIKLFNARFFLIFLSIQEIKYPFIRANFVIIADLVKKRLRCYSHGQDQDLQQYLSQQLD